MATVNADGSPREERVLNIYLGDGNSLLYRPTNDGVREVVFQNEEEDEFSLAYSFEELKTLHQALGTAIKLNWLSEPEGVDSDSEEG